MYISRLFATNGIVSIEFDALNGEVLALVREDTADNAAKNFYRKGTGILDGVVYIDDEPKHLNIPRYLQIQEDPSLKPTITVTQGDGCAEAILAYPYLVADGQRIDISAKVRVEIPKDDCRTRWYLTLDNRSGCEIQTVNFPQINGLWLGEDWEEDRLILPIISGCQIDNPSETLAEPPVLTTWKWQEYLHVNNMGNRCGVKDDRNIYVLKSTYTGGCSMLWMDLYSKEEGTGIYMTCRDREFKNKGITAWALGKRFPGIGMGIIHYPCMKQGVYETEECVVAFHEGDWHWAADEYREYREAIPQPVLKTEPMPQWFRESAGLSAHYDFMYQGGKIVHKFKDLPEIYKNAKEQGFNHLLISGWNIHGFDDGFPMYRPSPELGTEEELKAAVKAIRDDGGHLTFYVNSRLCNVGYEENLARKDASCAMNRDGSLRIENYGAKDINFAILCMNEPSWRKELVDNITYMIREMGLDSVYLDQLGMSPAILCYHPDHECHKDDPAAWNQGYEQLLDELREANPEAVILYEGCCDIYGSGVGAQLISTLRMPAKGVLTEVYKYTFPKQVLTDMLNPRRHSGMRAEHIARKSTFLLYKSFVLGSYFWCYDLEGDNTFRRDPEQQARLIKTVALRKAWLKRYGHGIFRDQLDLVGVDENAQIKHYHIDGGEMIACANEHGLSGEVKLKWKRAGNVKASILTELDPEPRALEVQVADGIITAKLPETELALIVLEEV